MRKIGLAVNKIMYYMVAIIIVILSILIFANVLLRYIFNSGIVWAPEVSTFLFIWLITIGSIISLVENEHMGVRAIVDKLPAKIKLIAYLVGSMVIIYLSTLIFTGSLKLTRLNIDSVAASTGWPMYLVYGSGLVMGTGMIIASMVKIYQLLFTKAKADESIASNTEDF